MRGQQWRRISIKRVLDRLYSGGDRTSSVRQSYKTSTDL